MTVQLCPECGKQCLTQREAWALAQRLQRGRRTRHGRIRHRRPAGVCRMHGTFHVFTDHERRRRL